VRMSGLSHAPSLIWVHEQPWCVLALRWEQDSPCRGDSSGMEETGLIVCGGFEDVSVESA
jgi:hypothetical protein